MLGANLQYDGLVSRPRGNKNFHPSNVTESGDNKHQVLKLLCLNKD